MRISIICFSLTGYMTAEDLQKDLQGKTFTLLQVFVDPKLNMIPKISANRYLLSVRFSGANFGNGPIAEIPEVMPFRLGLCNM